MTSALYTQMLEQKCRKINIELLSAKCSQLIRYSFYDKVSDYLITYFCEKVIHFAKMKIYLILLILFCITSKGKLTGLHLRRNLKLKIKPLIFIDVTHTKYFRLVFKMLRMV